MTTSHTSARDLVLCAMFSALIAIGAFIRITLPTEPYAMHFTLQWFFVLTAALLLGERGAFLSVLVYLLLGLAGLPVFASGGGLSYIARPTFGFLLGFLPAAWVSGFLSRHAGKLAERKKTRSKAGKTGREVCSKAGREEQEFPFVNENRERMLRAETKNKKEESRTEAEKGKEEFQTGRGNKEKVRRGEFRIRLFASVCGMLVDYAAGMLYYYLVGKFLLGYDGLLRLVLVNCCLLTIGGDFLLCVLASWAAERLKKIL